MPSCVTQAGCMPWANSNMTFLTSDSWILQIMISNIMVSMHVICFHLPMEVPTQPGLIRWKEMAAYTRLKSNSTMIFCHGPLARYVKWWFAHASGMPGTFPLHRLKRKPPVSDPGMHHGTCVTHVPWCMSGSLNRGGGKHNTDIPSASASGYFTYLARGPSARLFKELFVCWWCSSPFDLYTWSMFTPKLFQIFPPGVIPQQPV